jgi:hypothetical protein
MEFLGAALAGGKHCQAENVKVKSYNPALHPLEDELNFAKFMPLGSNFVKFVDFSNFDSNP